MEWLELNNKKNIIGGNKNKIYKFIYLHDDDVHYYILCDNNDNEKCVMMLINKQEKNAIIENINGDYESCSNGFELLDVTIKFLEDYSKKLLKFVRAMAKDYNVNTCTSFYNIYKKIIKDFKICSIYGRMFF